MDDDGWVGDEWMDVGAVFDSPRSRETAGVFMSSGCRLNVSRSSETRSASPLPCLHGSEMQTRV